MKKKSNIQRLKDVVTVQCANGNWNYDPYMHGMANGLILALAIFENKEPEYLEAPKVWLCDVNTDHVASEVEYEAD